MGAFRGAKVGRGAAPSILEKAQQGDRQQRINGVTSPSLQAQLWGLVLVKDRHREWMLKRKPDHTSHRGSNKCMEIFCCEKRANIAKMG